MVSVATGRARNSSRPSSPPSPSSGAMPPARDGEAAQGNAVAPGELEVGLLASEAPFQERVSERPGSDWPASSERPR